jgi:sarcosine oxidase
VTGQVTFGDELPAIAAALAGSGAPFERLAPGETRTRFPGLAVEAPALFEPDSGVLAADEVLRALGQTGSFVLRTGAEVMAVTGDGAAGGVALTLRDGETMRADVAVLCAGPRTLRLLGHSGSEAVAAPAALPQVAYFAATPGSASLPPVFIEWGADMIYGLPVAGRGAHAGTYKVSHHTPEGALDEFDPTDRAAFEDDPTLLAVLTEATRRLLPGLDPRPVATERCVYDNSADTDFVLDRVGPVVVGCGTSGHGFKFGPLLGELLADLSEGTAPAVDLSRFSLSRRPAGAGH